ncbi:MAG TPA: PAS domain S-box protein [Candidatus Saccharimonadales bacterium]|jgi:two-component system cell cycle sensor histidine kinase/response regulator CckA|nr:PAS domain S-box protein [Candidatus Saccharimonadales bacterium]
MPELISDRNDAGRVIEQIATLEGEIAELRLQLANVSSQASDRLVQLAAGQQDFLESEARYRALIELSSQCIWTADAKGNATWVNRYWFEYSGMNMDQTLGPGWTSALHPEDSASSLQQWQQVVAGGTAYENEVRFRRSDGQYLWHLVKAAPLKNTGGELAGYIGIAVEIHERKMAAAAIAEADERLRLAVEAAGMGTWDYYPRTRESKLSMRSRAILGLAANDHLDYQGFLARVHDADRDRIATSIEEAMDPQSASEYDVDYRVVWPDGSIRWVIARGKCFFAGSGATRKPMRFTGIMLDITERKQGDQERAKLVAMIQKSPDFIAVSEVLGKILFVNESGQKLTGTRPDGGEVASKNIIDYLSWEDRSRFQTEMAPAILSGAVWEGPVHLRNFETGKLALVEMRGFGIFDEDGQLSSIATLGRDISEREKLEEQLRLAQKMEAVGRLAGGIAHDFNNLLTIIKGYGEILRDNLQADAGNLKIIDEISGAANRAAALIAQLLAFSRRQVVQAQVVNLNESLLRVKSMLGRLVGEDVAIELQLDSHLWNIKIDPAHVDQILINLAANARDALPHGGTICIRTQNCDPDKSSTVQEGGVLGEHIRLSFSDDGSGMDPETLSRSFEPFFTTKQPGNGTGLGLAIVYGIVKQNGGQVSVISEPDGGTVFTLDFPRSSEKLLITPSAPPARRLQGSENILLVEDEAGVRHMLAEFVRKHGYHVQEAASAEEAQEISHRQPIDLLITDIVMPGANGCDLGVSLTKSHPKICIIFISGYVQHAALQDALLQPGTSFIQKPFSLEELLVKMRDILDQRRGNSRRQHLQ